MQSKGGFPLFLSASQTENVSLLSLYDCKIEISCISPYPLQLLAGAVVGTVPAEMYNQITAIHTHPEHPQFWLHWDSPRCSCRDTCSRVWPQDLEETSPPRCRKAVKGTNVARAAERLIREAAAGPHPSPPPAAGRAGQNFVGHRAPSAGKALEESKSSRGTALKSPWQEGFHPTG